MILENQAITCPTFLEQDLRDPNNAGFQFICKTKNPYILKYHPFLHKKDIPSP